MNQLNITQDELDRILTARVAREKQHSRKWEDRAKKHRDECEMWKREARKWERLAKENLAVIRAHEGTIRAFIQKLDDVLTED